MKKNQEENQEESLTIERSQSFVEAGNFADQFAKKDVSLEVKMRPVKPVQNVDEEHHLYYKGVRMVHLMPRANSLFYYKMAGDDEIHKVKTNDDKGVLLQRLKERMTHIDGNINEESQKQTEKVDKARKKD